MNDEHTYGDQIVDDHFNAGLVMMQSLWWVWFLGIETRIYIYDVENLHPRKFATVRYKGLI